MVDFKQSVRLFAIILAVMESSAIFNCPCGQGIEGSKKLIRRVKRTTDDDQGSDGFNSSRRRASRYDKGTSRNMSRVEQMAALLQDHSSDRIVNGYEPNERAWMVFMTMKKSLCGGSLINRRWVLTAAHCICSEENKFYCNEVKLKSTNTMCPEKTTRLKMAWAKSKLRLFLGINNKHSRHTLPRKFKKSRAQSPSQVIVHECYEEPDKRGRSKGHDIALVKLKRSVKISPSINNIIDDDLYQVQPLCLKDIMSVSKVYAAGWGNQRDDHCTTTLNSPSPNQRCRFPFEFNGHKQHECIKSGTELLKGYSKSRKNKKNRACYMLYKQYKNLPWEGADVVHIVHRKRLVEKCYMPTPRAGRWCATCVAKAKKGEPGYCGRTRRAYRGMNIDADPYSWGFCDTSKNGCRKGHTLTLADTLQEVALRVMKKKHCKERFEKIGYKNNFHMDREICAIGTYEKKIRTVTLKKGTKRWRSRSRIKFDIGEITTRSGQQGYRDACSGDSGGPLFYWKKGRAYQYGIVSRGIGCARNLSPGIYTEIRPYLGWIKENVGRRYNCK